MNTPTSPLQNTTHDWAIAVDGDHLARIRRDPATFASGGVQHLVLEVIAYSTTTAPEIHWSQYSGLWNPGDLLGRFAPLALRWC